MNFLYTAYAATWVVHIVYVLILVRGYSRLRDEIKELNKET